MRPFLVRGVLDRRIREHELGCDTTSLPQEGGTLRRVQVAVEVTAEDAFEAVVGEGEGECVALDERRAWSLPGGDMEHASALVEAGDRTRT